MMELTKERLQQIVHAAGLEPWDYEEVFDGITTGEIVMMARQLLSGMEQEPVAWIAKSKATGEIELDEPHAIATNPEYWTDAFPVYEAPQLPQPAVAITQHFDTISLDTAKMVMCDVNRRDEFLGGDIQLLSRIQCRIDEACRAAMLQGADQPQNAQQNIPENIPTLREGLAAIRNLGPIDAGKIQAERDALNEPDVPDGYALVPVEPTAEMVAAAMLSDDVLFDQDDDTMFRVQHGVIWRAMLAAAQDFREISNSSTKHFRENAETSTKCWCLACRPVTMNDPRFVVCPECGNKRCPHANDHRNACTGSNEPGQEGSAYPAAPQQEVK